MAQTTINAPKVSNLKRVLVKLPNPYNTSTPAPARGQGVPRNTTNNS